MTKTMAECPNRRRLAQVFCCIALILAPVAGSARGVSPYLPMQMAPEIEREIERLVSLAGMPILKKPYFAADIQEALRRACRTSESVCNHVRFYLERYQNDAGFTHAGVAGASGDETNKFVPNQRGMQVESRYNASAQAYWQPGANLLLTGSAVAYEGEIIPTALISLGYDVAQLDIGWREYWWSPFRDSATMISSNARPSPSIALSNYRPLTFLNIRYETFFAVLEETDGILYQGQRSPGQPRLFGLHLDFEPLPGFSLGLNRVMQFGGDGRSSSLSSLVNAFFNPSGGDNTGGGSSTDDEAGNQLASITSRFDYSGKFPFSVYMEYAGEDTSSSENFRLGNASLSVGIFLPKVAQNVDLTYEFSEFQNAWYVNNIYANGYTNDGSVIGHWVGNERVFGDAVGTQTNTVILNWEFAAGNLLHATYRTVNNADYSSVNYVRGHELLLRYSRALGNFVTGVETYGGRTTIDDDFITIGGFLRW